MNINNVVLFWFSIVVIKEIRLCLIWLCTILIFILRFLLGQLTDGMVI